MSKSSAEAREGVGDCDGLGVIGKVEGRKGRERAFENKVEEVEREGGLRVELEVREVELGLDAGLDQEGLRSWAEDGE